MDTYELITSLVDSLAWPLVILIIVIILKSPINKLFSNLSKLRYNELEMEFSKSLEAVEENLNDNFSPTTERIVKDPEMERIINSKPEAAVLISFKNIEDELFNTFVRLGLEVESNSINSSKYSIDKLAKLGYLDDETSYSLKELKNLRNLATHSSVSITTDAADNYYELSLKVINKLKQLNTSEK
ncbi:MAG: hypothetical protein RR588_03070 [Solibacillus sp.]